MPTVSRIVSFKCHHQWTLISCLVFFELLSCSSKHVETADVTEISRGIQRRSTDECSRDVQNSFTCERTTLSLVCNAGEVISVISALYGRRTRSRCSSSAIYTTNCRAEKSLTIVQSRCDGKTTCSVPANNNVFGDPCVGTYKYLEIQFSCMKAQECCPVCQNAGICRGVNVCQCQPGFEGDKCKILSEFCPENIKKYAQLGRNGTNVTWNEPKDTQQSNVTVTHRSGDFFNIGSTTVFYNIENIAFSAGCSFTVEVIDNEPPTINCPSDYEGFAELNTTSATVSWPLISASDNSGVIPSTICNETNGSTFPVGTTEVNCVTFDRAGNNNTCSFLVHIRARCPSISTNTHIGLLSWPKTVAGMTVESTERCPVNSERRNFGLATRECASSLMYGAVWLDVMVNSCGEIDEPAVEDLASTTVTEDNVEEVAETLANVIESSYQETDEIDINAVQETLTNIVNVESPSVEVTEAVVEVVDHILSVNTSVEETRASQMSSSIILKSFEQQISQTLKNEDSFRIKLPNVVVEAITLDQTQARNGLSFEVNHNIEFVNGSTEYNDNENDTSNSTSSIVLPSEVLFNRIFGNETKVSFVSYNEDHLFRSRILSVQNNSTILGPIISAVILGNNITNSSTPIIIQTATTKADKVDLNSSRCVFWDFNLNDGIGDWAQDGCQLVNIGANGTTCHCNHLTNFAVLVDYIGQESTDDDFYFALDIISKIGCALSIASLCLTLLVFLSTRRLRQTLPRKILIQFCISMLCLYLVFLVGIDATSTAGCLVIAALLHYFMLATIFWMAVEARHMYIHLVSVFDMAGSHFMLKAACFAWGLPLIPVGVTLGVAQEDYIADTYCFLAPGYGLYFGLLLPVALVIFNNSITFLLIIRRLLKSNVGGNVDKNTIQKRIAERLKTAFIISILLGLTWVFGFLAVAGARRAFQFLFCVANSFQGVLVFIQFCLNQEDVRKVLKNACFVDETRNKNHSSDKTRKFASDTSNASQFLPSMTFSTEDQTVMLKSKSGDLNKMENVYNEIATAEDAYESVTDITHGTQSGDNTYEIAE